MTLDDVERLARSLPDVEEGTSYGNRAWKVRGKTFVWERPLRARDREELADAAPDGPVVGVAVEHLVAKEAVIRNEPGCFTTAHFDGYAAVLVALDDVDAGLLDELITDAWLTKAPKATAADFIARGDV